MYATVCARNHESLAACEVQYNEDAVAGARLYFEGMSTCSWAKREPAWGVLHLRAGLRRKATAATRSLS